MNKNDKPNLTLDEAIEGGYRCTEPDSEPKLLMELLEDLGSGYYHLASMNQVPGGIKDCVIHRVIGSGWDVEIYGPIPDTRKGRYCVALWENYGNHLVEELREVPAGNVGDRVMDLVETYCPLDVCKAIFS